MLILLLVVGLLLILIYFVLNRYPDTKTRIDHALKDFKRKIVKRAMAGRSSSEARVNILVPAQENDFFDNPLATLQPPLTLNVMAPGTSAMVDSSNRSI